MNIVDVTIIGGGPVGLFGSFYAGLRGMSVRIIDSLPELGGQLTALYPEKDIYDMPGFPCVVAKDLVSAMVQQGREFGPEIVLGEEAVELEKTDFGYTLVTHKGNQFNTRTILITAGAGAFSPTKVGALGEEKFEGRGIYYGVKEKALFNNKSLVIVGGGDSALDWALNLEPIAKEIKLVHRRDQFRAHEETVRLAQKTDIKFKLHKVIKEFYGNGVLQGVVIEDTQTKNQERLEADAVIINVGYKSSLGPIQNWGLNIEKRKILVDQFYQTNLPGIFAAGDVATYESKIKLIATGVGEAATAVCFIKTQLDPKAKLFPGHSTDMDLKEIRNQVEKHVKEDQE